MKRFALVGAAGYVAPRHMMAIKEIGGDLVAITDPSDSVGIIDRYFPNAKYFSSFERFERFVNKCQLEHQAIEYLSVCSPNHFHDTHCRFGLKNNMTVICEKPLVLNPWNVDALQQVEQKTGNRIYNILQLRLHPKILQLKEELRNAPTEKRHVVNLNYVTRRGAWYHASWKGQLETSGGIATNIGVHLFDMLLWLFGDVQGSDVDIHTAQKASGKLTLKHADVNWFLSIDQKDLPADNSSDTPALRAISVDGDTVEFTKGCKHLHTLSYQQILDGKGFTTEDVKPAIDLIHKIRKAYER